MLFTMFTIRVKMFRIFYKKKSWKSTIGGSSHVVIEENTILVEFI